MRYFPVITMLTAGAVTCIVSIANDMDKLFSLFLLLGVLIVFYIIGLIAKGIIMKVIEAGGIKEEEASETDAAEAAEGAGEETQSQEEASEPEEGSGEGV